VMAPEMRFRRQTRRAGGKESSAIRIPRYVVPQNIHTQISARYAVKCG
jgi:hypothetical protein